MRRVSLALWLSVVGGLLGLQCLDPLSEDCTKTLTCGDAPAVTLGRDCVWRYADDTVWTGAPLQRDGRWVWPDGTVTLTQNPNCTPRDAGVEGDGGPDCTVEGVTCGGSLVCDPTSKRCVECLNEGHCANDPTQKACDIASKRCVTCLGPAHCEGENDVCKVDLGDSQLNRCVECVDSEQCDAGEICNPVANQCTVACAGDPSRCPPDKPVCNDDPDACVECAEHPDCAEREGRTQCSSTNVCVQCTNNEPCAPDQVCDTAANVCVDCVADADCGNQHCDLDSHTCVPCTGHDHCTDVTASRCNPTSNTCETCNNSSECEEGAPLCRLSDGRCVSCTSDLECGTNLDRPHCDTTNGPQTGTCVECTAATSDGDCDEDPARSRCDTASGLCARCINSDDCGHLGATPVCTGGASAQCVQCTSSTDCNVPNRAGPVCKLAPGGGPAAINTCVECLTNADCTDPAASTCIQNQCEPCTSDEGCSGILGPPNNSAFICDTSVPNAGVCVQCTGTRAERCTVNGEARVCNSRARTCSDQAPNSADRCDECIADAQCQVGQRCVEQRFGTGNQSVGFFCFTETPNDLCPLSGQPFVSPKLNQTSIDGVLTDICGLQLTTCPALQQSIDVTTCSGGNEACGAAGLDDGICSGGRCTVPCGADGANCFVERTCNVNVTPSICN